MRRLVWLVVLFLVVPALPLAAQVTESVTVEVIEVPVYVSRDGKPVQGLTREDFTLRVNGRPQPIEYFEVVNRRAAGADAPVLNRRRMTLLLFDVLHSLPWTMRRARLAAAELVASASPTDSYAVAALTSAGIALLVPFTTDHANVQRAIASFSASDARDAFGLATTAEERAIWSARANDITLDRIEVSRELSHESLMGGLANAIRTMQARDMTRQLGELARVLAPLEGQKSVILMSHGIASSGPFPGTAVMGDLLEMHEDFRTSGVILNAVDLTGLTAPIGRPHTPSPQLFQLALSTGGSVEHSNNNFLSALRQIEEAESVVYILGFRPPAHQTRGTNSIRVKVRDAGLRTEVRYREAYRPSKPGVDVMNTVLLADILLNDIPQTGVTVSADVKPAAGSAAITVSLPSREVFAYVGNEKAHADVFVYVFDSNNNVAAFGRQRIDIDGSSSTTLQVEETLPLAPGSYVAKVLVRLPGKNATGFTRTAFEVTAPPSRS